MRIGLAQINTTVGDLSGNREKIIAAYHSLVAAGAELAVFPELAVTGYPPRDLLYKRRFGDDAEGALLEIAAATGEVPALVGTLEGHPAAEGRPFYNAAALCQHGAIQQFGRKCLLPTYDVFDEDRYFEAALQPSVFTLGERRIGVTICEDIWQGSKLAGRNRYRTDPLVHLAGERLDLMVNLSASPWHHGKGKLRQQLVRDAAAKLNCPVVYVNAVGGNDELVFDGRSMVVGPDGGLVAGLPAFREANQVVPVPTAGETAASLSKAESFDQVDMADIFDALVLGLRDYVYKSGFKQCLVALSGGIDSAVVAAVAVAAFGAENVRGVSLPSSISSQHSRDDARALADNLGMAFDTVEIASAVSAAEQALAPLFLGRPVDVTEENIQARIRGTLMMALSNKFGAILLTTGNKSEIAVGYCTLYGDMCGGLAVISDLFKTQVFALSRWLNRDREVIPWNTINKPPSAELRPDQKDEDSLPPYEILDAILRGYVEEGASSRELIGQGFDPLVVKDIVRKVDLNEYKRKQAAPGLKITPLAFGVGRRIPIVQRYVS
jgi:NAD+ synthase (glutamine-hydrolysing)